MADSVRELIVKNILTTLEGIADIRSVQRLRQSGMKKNITPCIWIEEGQETVEDMQGVVERKLRIALALISRHDEALDTISSAEHMAPLRDNIDRELMIDRQRGDNANETTSLSWNDIEVIEGQPELIQVGIFTVIYYTSLTDPAVKEF